MTISDGFNDAKLLLLNLDVFNYSQTTIQDGMIIKRDNPK